MSRSKNSLCLFDFVFVSLFLAEFIRVTLDALRRMVYSEKEKTRGVACNKLINSVPRVKQEFRGRFACF